MGVTTTVKAFLACLLCLILLAGAACASYRPTDLGTLGGTESWALGVNASGTVVGCSIDRDGHQRAFMWTQEKGMVDIGTLGGPNAAATHINDAGEIAGYSDTADGARHAFLRTSDGNMVDLGVLDGDAVSEAAAVEDSVVGWSRGAQGPAHAFSWAIDSGLVPLTPLVAGGEAHALSTNAVGVIAGSATDAAGNVRAVVWPTANEPNDLGTLGGQTGQALGINETGVAVGESANADGNSRAFFWVPEAGIRELALPRGTLSARASSINSANQVAGSANDTNRRAIVWNLGENLKAVSAKVAVLPMLRGATESEASAISNGGSVAGYCRLADGSKHAVLWRAENGKQAIAVALCVGGYAPTSSATRDEFDDLWTRVSFTTFERVKATTPHITFEVGSYKFTGTMSAKLTPVTFGITKGFNPGRLGQSYMVLRAGPYWGRLIDPVRSINERSVGLNVNAAFGVVVAKSFYVELRYDYFSKLSGVDFRGISASAGIRLFDIAL